MDFITNIYNSEYFGIITAVMALATAITAVTPSKTDNKVMNVVAKIFNICAGNILKNKNADAE